MPPPFRGETTAWAPSHREPAGRRLLGEIGPGRAGRAVDLGCGAMGWLGLLSDWVGPDGHVVGTDVQEEMLEAAARFVDEERLDNVEIVRDDVFASQLEPDSFDLVHARFLLGPLGRGDEQLRTYLRLLRPGGILVLEDVDPASWHFLPPAPACAELLPWSPRPSPGPAATPGPPPPISGCSTTRE